MKKLFHCLTNPPVFADPAQNKLAQILHYLLLLGVVLGAGFAVVGLSLTSEKEGPLISAALSIIFAVLLGLLQRRQLRFVSFALIMSFYGAVMFSLAVNDSSSLRNELALVLIAVSVTIVILRQLVNQVVAGTEKIRQQAAALQEKNETLLDTQQALLAAKEEAELANQAKNDFLSRLSHDLRTPLNSMIGFTNVLLDDSTLADEVRVEWLHRIQSNGEYMQRMINDLLDLSRIEAGKLQLYPVKLPLTAFLMEVIILIQMQVQQKSFQFVYQFDDNLPDFVMTDETRLRQILVNLLGNAIKFTPQGTVTLRVKPVPATDSDPIVRFEVIDTGIGISPADLKRIFEPFEQAGAGEQREKGTGLGLAISRHLVELLGGDLQAESQLGTGSRFWFDLPFSLDEKPA